ncbi:MAG: aminotransferase [Acidobacteriia bacterium]|nr:aminotransferase [Terriglobia bacterium]
MKFCINPLLAATDAPPIPEVQGWAAGRKPGDPPTIDLLQAVPGYPPDPSLTAYLAEKVMDFGMSLYTPIQGTSGLRGAFAAEISTTYGAPVEPDQVCITAGCNQAFYAAMIALARAGDNVILPTPFYFNHQMTLDMLGLQARHLQAREQNGFVPDPDEATALLDGGTRALVLVTPNNPTGAVYPPEILERFFDLAASRRIALILDETYRDFLPLTQSRAHDLFLRPEWHDTLIHLYSFSKAFSLAGYRVGATVASARFVGQVLKIMDCLVICAPHISQVAAQFGVERLTQWREQKRVLMAGRINAFRRALTARAGQWVIGSIGAYFAYLRHPFEKLSSIQAAKRLADRQSLLCLPGSAFGPGQERYLRAAFANIESSQMTDIAHRLALSAEP